MSRMIITAARSFVARVLDDGDLVANVLGREIVSHEEFADRHLEDAIATGVRAAIAENGSDCRSLVHAAAIAKVESVAKQMATEMLCDMASQAVEDGQRSCTDDSFCSLN